MLPYQREGDNLFCKSSPFVQKAWDSTSIGLYKTCPRKYYYTIIEGWTGRGEKAALSFGILLHGALELYDRLRVAGDRHPEAQRKTVRWLLEQTTSYQAWFFNEAKERIVHLPLKRLPAEGEEWYGLLDFSGYEEPLLSQIKGGIGNAASLELRPVFWTPDDTKRSRETLVRTFVWYTEHFISDALTTIEMPDGKPALELSFRLELPILSPDGDPYLLCGHLDKMARLGGQVFIQERKHTVQTLGSYYFDKYNPNGQVSNYCIAAQVVFHEPVAGCIVDAAQVAVNFSRFGRSIAPRTKGQLEEYMQGLAYWIKRAEADAQAGYWPMNEESCDKYGGCPFRNICGKDPAVRNAFLAGEFQRKPWNPLQNRD